MNYMNDCDWDCPVVEEKEKEIRQLELEIVMLETRLENRDEKIKSLEERLHD